MMSIMRTSSTNVLVHSSCHRVPSRMGRILSTMRTVTSNKNTTGSNTQDDFDETKKKKEKKIGFIGLGNMGLPMCLNLTKNGTSSAATATVADVVVMAFDVNAATLDEAARGGAHPATRLEDIAEQCSIIFTMLPGCQALNTVMPQVLDAVSESTLFVDCSTVSPSTSRRWNVEARTHHHNHDFIDAPVSGGVKGAQDATLTFMVGCVEDSPSFMTAKPLLELMGKRVISCGGPGTGAATKLCNNLALATQMIGISEAMNLGEELGVNPETLASAMNTSTAKCWSSEVNNPHPEALLVGGSESSRPATKGYEGGFGTKLMLKDLGLAVAAGEESGVALPLGTASKELYRLAALRGLGDKDFGVILQFLRGR